MNISENNKNLFFHLWGYFFNMLLCFLFRSSSFSAICCCYDSGISYNAFAPRSSLSRAPPYPC
jgi:hypothetical protein